MQISKIAVFIVERSITGKHGEVPDMWALEQAKGPNTPSKRLSCGEYHLPRLDLPFQK